MAKKKRETSSKKKNPTSKAKNTTKSKGAKEVEKKVTSSSTKKETVKKEKKPPKEEVKKTSPKRKKCEKCGASLPARSKFCLECGNYLGKDGESFLTPNTASMPGVMPIPESAKFQNVVKTEKKEFTTLEPAKKKKNNVIFYFLCIFLVAASLFVLFFFKTPKQEDSTISENSNTSSNKTPEESNNQQNSDDPLEELLLDCSIEEDYGDGITGLSTAKYYYAKDTLVKVEEEESVLFTDKALIYYSFYEQSLQEELENDEFKYDNTSLELKKEKNKIGLLYTIHLKDMNSDANNLTDLKGTTYEQAKKNLEKEGYTCK